MNIPPTVAAATITIMYSIWMEEKSLTVGMNTSKLLNVTTLSFIAMLAFNLPVQCRCFPSTLWESFCPLSFPSLKRKEKLKLRSSSSYCPIK